MNIREATCEDWTFIRDAHRRAGYGYELPQPANMHALHVAEEDGQFLGAAGFEGIAQIFAVVEPNFMSPHRRMEVIKALHRPVARHVLYTDATAALAFLDPKFPGFARRLMRNGWSMKLWPCLFVERGDIERAYGERKCDCV